MVFPAPAGVILARGYVSRKRLGFPRTCGGDPQYAGYAVIFALFSPHLRG